jgi:hypothetical protein
MSEPLIADLIDAHVGAAVASELRRATIGTTQQDVDQAGAIRAELEQLRATVAAQAATIATLREQLDRAEQATRMLPTEELVAALLAAVARGTSALSDHVVSDLRLDLRAALTTGNGGDLVVGEPTLTDSHLLSTISLAMRPLPPAPGQPSRADVLDVLRSGADAAQQALEILLPTPASAGPASGLITAFGALAQDPAAPGSWSGVRAALPALADAVPDLAESAQRLNDAAATLLAQPAPLPLPTETLLAALAPLAAFTEAVSRTGE